MIKLSDSNIENENAEIRIEIIPLIDIMFFLLAAFMLVSLSMTYMQRVPLNLPKATTSENSGKLPQLQIAIDEKGIITWDGVVTSPLEITQRLQTEKIPATETIMISAAKSTSHGKVMEVLDSIRAGGGEKVCFETKR